MVEALRCYQQYKCLMMYCNPDPEGVLTVERGTVVYTAYSVFGLWAVTTQKWSAVMAGSVL